MKKLCKNGAFLYGESLKKLLLTMKLTLLLTFIGFNLAANVYSQNEKLSIDFTQTTVREILREIEQKTDYSFLFKDEAMQLDKKITVQTGETTVEGILQLLLKDTDMNYQLIGSNFIVIAPKEILQGIKVTGKVTDASGTPLPGVNIVEVGTTNGAVTDLDGNYSITVSSEDAVLSFSFVGYLTEEVDVGGQTSIDVTLIEDIQALDEVVVVGYGTQRKSDITGAIVSVSSEELQKTPAMNVVQAMQGKAAGIDISAGGQRKIGDNPVIRIRGNRSITADNSPLIVLDGIPYSGNFNDLNPNDIASIEILKDASSTAIYGSRGANGVILISTLRGKQGKPSINYKGFYGVTDAIGDYNWMNAEQYLKKLQYSYWNGELNKVGPLPSPEDVLNPIELENYNKGVDTDWHDLVYDKGSKMNHQLSVGGGTEKATYMVSMNYYNEKGLMANTLFNRLGIRINLDQEVASWLNVGTSTFVSLTKNNPSSGNIPFRVYLIPPLGTPYDENGELIYDPANDGLATNPLMDAQKENFLNEKRGIAAFPTLFANVNFFEGLDYRINLGGEAYYNRDALFMGKNSLSRGQGTPYSGMQNSNRMGYTFENILTFKKELGIHSVNVTGVYSTQMQRYENSSIYTSDQPYESSLFYNLGGAPVVEGYGSDLTEWTIMSYMGRLNYGIKNKYLLTFAVRADGSSRLAEGNKWSTFPSGAIAWRLSEEQFLQNVDAISNLKIRTSYGITGNTAIDPYVTKGGLGQTVYMWQEKPAFGYRPNLIANPELGWEESATLNIGLDFGLWAGRVNGSFELYETNTSGLLLERQLPTTSGFQSILQNVGKTQNKGWELTINTDNLGRSSAFSWMTQLNLFANKEKIVSLYNAEEDDLGNRWFIGHPVQVFYDYVRDGIFQPGEEEEAETQGGEIGGQKFKDIDGDGVITPDNDRKIVGSPIPELSLGMTNTFEYKNFSLSFLLYGRYGQEIQGIPLQFGPRFNSINVEFWTEETPDANYPQPGTIQAVYPGGRYYDGSFLKVRHINFGYYLPQKWLKSIDISSCRVYFTAESPFYFSKYKFADPEKYDGNLGSYTVPNVKAYLFGIEVNL